MKFTVQGPFKYNTHNLMRKTGYHFHNSAVSSRSELSFVRPSRGYPRFHIYLKEENDNLIFNLHLDQKRPVYKGSPAHSADYQGEVLEQEAERIKQYLKNNG